MIASLGCHRLFAAVAAWAILISCDQKPATTAQSGSQEKPVQQSVASASKAPQVGNAIAKENINAGILALGDVPALHKQMAEIHRVSPELVVVISSVPVADSVVIREQSELPMMLSIERNHRIIYRDTTGDGLAYALSMPIKKRYPMWLPVVGRDGVGELLVAFANRPSKELVRRFRISGNRVTATDTLPSFFGAAKNLDADSLMEFAGIQNSGQEWDDEAGRRWTTYDPILYYERRPTGLALDSALTRRMNKQIYGEFRGYQSSERPGILAKAVGRRMAGELKRIIGR